MNLKDKKILLTGGLGFIGSNLADHLENAGAKITIFDLAQGDDIQDYQKLRNIVKKKFDVIYHLAGYSGPTKSNDNKQKSFTVNTSATADLCELLVKYSPRTKLILSSSRLEYGKPRYFPVDENHPLNPTSVYGLSKLSSTQISQVFNQKFGLDVTVFRTSNTYGPHKKQFEGYNIINNFIDQALEGKTLTIYGDGEQERDYIFITDLVTAFTLAAEKPDVSKGQIYNLGLGIGIKFKEMVNLIIDKAPKGKIQYVPWPKSYMDVETGSYISDISKLGVQLGFTPKISFEEGIVKTIQAVK